MTDKVAQFDDEKISHYMYVNPDKYEISNTVMCEEQGWMAVYEKEFTVVQKLTTALAGSLLFD